MTSVDVVDLDHVAIRVTDLDRSLRFYHELLGMDVRDRERFENGAVPFLALVAGGRHIHVVPVDEETIDVGGEHVCYLLRSEELSSKAQLESICAAIDDAGFEVESGEPKKRYGAYGRDWAAYVRDPDGRRVELKVH
ncbi:MAG: VOC family protein [Halobacteriota archaeon]